MPIASALSSATVCGESRRARAIGRPRKIVKPAIAPSSTVIQKLSARVPARAAGIIARYIEVSVFGVPT